MDCWTLFSHRRFGFLWITPNPKQTPNRGRHSEGLSSHNMERPDLATLDTMPPLWSGPSILIPNPEHYQAGEGTEGLPYTVARTVPPPTNTFVVKKSATPRALPKFGKHSR